MEVENIDTLYDLIGFKAIGYVVTWLEVLVYTLIILELDLSNLYSEEFQYCKGKSIVLLNMSHKYVTSRNKNSYKHWLLNVRTIDDKHRK